MILERPGALSVAARPREPRQPPSDAGFKQATRVQESLLAPLERRCLRWLASRMPASIGPDTLTLLGLFAMVMGGLSYALAKQAPLWLWAVNFWLAVNWFGDSLDGTLARYRDRQRPRYGYYVDHMIDAVGSLLLIGGLGLSGLITERVAMGVLAGFLLLMINSYLAAHTIERFNVSFFKFSPTEMRILLAIGNAYAYRKPYVTFLGARHLFFDVGCVIAIIGMALFLIVSVAINTVTLYRIERLE